VVLLFFKFQLVLSSFGFSLLDVASVLAVSLAPPAPIDSEGGLFYGPTFDVSPIAPLLLNVFFLRLESLVFGLLRICL